MTTNKCVLVTGGLGYIGSHTVVELIHKGYTPLIVDNLSNSGIEQLQRIRELTDGHIEFIQLDLRSQDELNNLFNKYPISAVMHFAALKSVSESNANPLEYYENNVGGLLNLLNSMTLNKVSKIIFSSSATVYGNPKTLPIKESARISNAENPYGRTKQFSEHIISDCLISGAIKQAIMLRYFNPIGAHPSGKLGELPIGKPNNLVPYLTQAAKGLQDELTIYGSDYATEDGTCIRDYIHVVDLAQAHVAALSYLNDKHDALCEYINLGTGRGVSVLELIKTFEKVNKISIPYKFGDRRKGDVPALYASTQKAYSLLKWRPKYSISDALEHAWNWQNALDAEQVFVSDNS